MTKERICEIINNYRSKRRAMNSKVEYEKVEIKVPVYKSIIKKMLVAVIEIMLPKKFYYSNEEPKISRLNFAKFITPDDWQIFVENKKDIPLIASPKYIKELESCWEIGLVAEFYTTDLRYGVLPKDIFKFIPMIGLGPIILGKESNKFYQLGSVHWMYYNIIEEYEKFIKSGKSEIKWDKLEFNVKI